MNLRMCRIDTQRLYKTKLAGLLLAVAATLAAQDLSLAWRPVGSTVVAQGRAGFSGEAVRGIWFSADEQYLEVELNDGRVYQRSLNLDEATWKPAARSSRLAPYAAIANRLPESSARVLGHPAKPYLNYALGEALWTSEDQGRTWTRLASNDRQSLIGSQIHSLAVGRAYPDRLAVATSEGIFLSQDAGQSWLGLNEQLPNIHIPAILAAPGGGRGLLAIWHDGVVLEWVPGSRQAWLPRGQASTWQKQVAWSDASRPGLRLEWRSGELLRTLDAGITWDALTSNLQGQQIRGITADRAGQAIYLATDRGVFYASYDLESRAAAPLWLRLTGAIAGRPALDVHLDEAGVFLYASLAGEGLFLTQAPHRRQSPRLISAADFRSLTAAPGALVTLVGAKIEAASINGAPLPLLSREDGETQFQIPFGVPATELSLDYVANGATRQLRLPLQATAPVIFTDREGAPLLVDAASGELMDPLAPLHAGQRIQILMTGLGKVEPQWPAGTPAPQENSPRVLAPLRVWFNGQTLEVLRSELAPGYVGFYLVEVKLPPILDRGVAPLAVEAGATMSNTILLRVNQQ